VCIADVAKQLAIIMCRVCYMLTGGLVCVLQVPVDRVIQWLVQVV
jgi:hypothetical protein